MLDLAGHDLERRKLFLFLIVFALESLVLVAEGVDFTAEGIIVGNLPGHPEIAGDHAEQRNRTEKCKYDNYIQRMMGDMNAPQPPMQRVRQNDYKIMLLHSSPIQISARYPRSVNLSRGEP